MSENPPPPDRTSLDDADSDSAVDRELHRRTRRGFIVGLAAAAAGFAGWRWLGSRPEVDGVSGPLRTALRFNERLTRSWFDPARRVAELPPARRTPGGPRKNGDIGLDESVDASAWRMRVAGTPLALTLADLRMLPEVSQITPLRCIEGWTTVAEWTGVRLVDFTERFYPKGRMAAFVGLSTPDRAYYVGLDAESAFHPQTLLCYAINGEPLTVAHGAPLRLLIPTKYGIKNLKRIGEISYATKQPSDYWAEQGYDWYAGL